MRKQHIFTPFAALCSLLLFAGCGGKSPARDEADAGTRRWSRPASVPPCGDGIVTAPETCDDGNTSSGDGCSGACQLEPGWACDVPGQSCHRTVCGDGKTEGTEQCDDGNTVPFDGCSPTCTKEPSCTDGSCLGLCGDGIVYPGEECDDGNNLSGDGCSADCKLERDAGYTCTNVTSKLPSSIDVPVVYRDFRGVDEDGGHPDFEHYGCTEVSPGLVQSALVNRLPAFQTGMSSVGCGTQITSQATFDQWYRDVDGVNKTIVGSVRLTLHADTTPPTYLYDSLTTPLGRTAGVRTTGFFPLDDKPQGWGPSPVDPDHDFHFTTELRYWFTFQGGEQLDFSGDDDVWVFVNGRLALDLGGLHSRQEGGFTLDPATAQALGLAEGGIYEMSLFHAERHADQSNFKLTLGGFAKITTHCASVCGDGIQAADEECDDGNTVDGDGCSSTCHVEATLN